MVAQARHVGLWGVYMAHECEYANHNPVLNFMCPRSVMETFYEPEDLPYYLYGLHLHDG